MCRPAIVAAVVLLAVLAGCAPDDPYADDHERASASPAPAQPHLPPGELAGTVPRGLQSDPGSFPQASSSPTGTIRHAAELYGNWTSRTVRARLARMAAVSVGTARAQLRQAAAEAARGMQGNGIRSQARLAAVVVDGVGDARSAIVVTRERVTGPDVPDAGWRYRVTLARLTRRHDKWVIAR
jgi:hypothetical protein